eukprot:1139227-Pelagomonas_calceolata.AAC.7
MPSSQSHLYLHSPPPSGLVQGGKECACKLLRIWGWGGKRASWLLVAYGPITLFAHALSG